MVPSASATAPKRAAPKVGLVEVEDYVGRPAGEAARAIRRAGLRPALDRQPGHPTELIGRVVAQDPPGGQAQQRAGTVTLYVGAPEPQREGEASSDARLEQAGGWRAVALADVTPVAPAPPIVVSEHAPAVSPPHAPEPAAEPEPEPPAAVGNEASADTWDDEQLEPETRDLFGSAELPRRRLYPREPLTLRLSGTRALLRRRRPTVVIGTLVLGWIIFTLAGHHAAAPARSGPPAQPAPVAAPAPRAQTPAVPPPARRSRRARPHRPARRVRRAVAPPPRNAGPAAAAAVIRTTAASPPPSASTQTPEQTGGGPFSP